MMSNFIPIAELKEKILLSSFLARLGHDPVPGKNGREKKYISMLRDSDTDPSFCVDDEQGLWFDHGLRQGGDVVDFGVRYWPQLNFREVLEKIVSVADTVIAPVSGFREKRLRPRKTAVRLPHYKIQDIRPLGSNQVITDYLRSRGVWDVANHQMREIYYYVEDEKKLRKNYFAVGWQNQDQCWEVRNKYFKGSLGKKSISVLDGDPNELAIFEGYMNYLSWLRYFPGSRDTVIVLNSLVNLPAAIEYAADFEKISLYLDHDSAGRQATAEIKAAVSLAVDCSAQYAGFNDYNEKLMQELQAFGMLGEHPVNPKSY